MLNNGFYYLRLDRCHRDGKRDYPKEIYPFGSIDIELFAHEFKGYWRVTEKKTGLLIANGVDLDEAQKNAHKVIDEYGGQEKFTGLIKDTVQKINSGLEYDYENKYWFNPAAEPVTSEILAPEIGADE